MISIVARFCYKRKHFVLQLKQMEAMIETVMIYVAAVLFGAIFGSFACCQAWRLRFYIQKRDSLGERSVCMYCRHQIAWYDNIPILSWLFLRGRCRYCRRKIGIAEVISEVCGVLTGLVVANVYILPMLASWNAGELTNLELILRVMVIIITIVLLIAMGVLAVYDGKWGELPTRLLILTILCALLVFGLNLELTILETGSLSLERILSILGSLIILPGVCYFLYRASGEAMMGGGDWMLALAIALVLGDWWLALWVLAGANILGTLIMAPVAVVKRHTSIHFGPFLVAAFVIALFAQDFLLTLI